MRIVYRYVGILTLESCFLIFFFVFIDDLTFTADKCHTINLSCMFSDDDVTTCFTHCHTYEADPAFYTWGFKRSLCLGDAAPGFHMHVHFYM
jgi:hypothetical protein